MTDLLISDALLIYDTMSQLKKIFIPINPKKIGIYVCGITVYDYCHVGHARTALAFDVIVRYLKHKYGAENVVFVRNITDIDDKIINRAKENNESVTDLTTRFIAAMQEDFAALGLIKPDHEPRATQYMPQMVEMTRMLVAKNYAYEAPNGDVYYKVRSFAKYGWLSKRKLDDLSVGARVELNEAKLDPLDFVLWKKAKEGEPSWDSLWGKGRPGWHLECAAMSTDLLGNTFDIHGGGFDLIFPHHENECAEAEACTGKDFVNYWMHVGFLQINQEKMAKSANNFVTIRDALKEVDAEELRFFVLSGHYRSQLDYALEQVKLTRNALARLYTALQGVTIPPETKAPETSDYAKRFYAAMDDDFNTPEAIAALFELARDINTAKQEHPKNVAALCQLLKELAAVLGILQRDPAQVLGITKVDQFDQQIQDLIKAREAARVAKDWAQADKIRDQLKSLGVSLEDTGKAGVQAKKS
jgi:cysteinyl-tRNA synthetase